MRVKLNSKIDGIKKFLKFKLKNSKIYNEYFLKEKVYKKYGSLSDEEIRYFYSFSEVIYPVSDRNERRNLYKIIHQWIKKRTEEDGYFREYKKCISIIKDKNKKSNTNFFDLPKIEIIELLDDLYDESDRYEIPGNRNLAIMFRFTVHFMIHQKKYRKYFILETVRKDLIKGIFSSQLGWSLVGYDSMPGVKGKYMDYTKPPKLIN